jgi:hypothetical protein
MFDFRCAKNVKNRSRGLACFFLDQYKGDDEYVKDLWNGCCGSSMFDGLGILSWVCNVFIMRKKHLLDNGSSRDFGNKGILECVIDYTHWLCPEFLSNLLEEPCDVVKLVSMGFLLLGYELPFPLSNLLTLRMEIKRETNPLWSI